MSPQHTCIALLISWSTATYASMLQEHKKPLFYLRSAWTQLTPSWLSFICTTTSTYTAASICTATSIYAAASFILLLIVLLPLFLLLSLFVPLHLFIIDLLYVLSHTRDGARVLQTLWYCKPLRPCRRGIENLRPFANDIAILPLPQEGEITM